MTLLSPGPSPSEADDPEVSAGDEPAQTSGAVERPVPQSEPAPRRAPDRDDVLNLDIEDPPLPHPRGPITERLLDHLVLPPHELQPLPIGDQDPITGHDSALALHLCYELHYRGLPEVDAAWGSEQSQLRARRRSGWAVEEGLTRPGGQH